MNFPSQSQISHLYFVGSKKNFTTQATYAFLFPYLVINTQLMERRKFISEVGLSVAGICAVCLGACSKSNAPGGTAGPANVNFTVDLNSSLLSVGNSIIQSGVIVVRIAAGNTASSFTAVQVNCTHEGTAINYNTGQGIFICPNHGSRFSTNGTVLLGPATSNLNQYNINVVGTSLHVTG